jgi:hypothetical protein
MVSKDAYRKSLRTCHLIAGGALAATLFAGSLNAEEQIKQRDMPRYCQLEAASAFGVSPSEVSTLPAEQKHDEYRVYGQTPPTGQNALFFKCTFDEDKRFVKVKKDSDSRAQAGGGSQSQGGGGVAVADMARYCAGEASAKFQQRPQNISTQPAIEDQGMYSVFGQFPPSGANPTVFICTFTADGELVGVDKQ